MYVEQKARAEAEVTKRNNTVDAMILNFIAKSEGTSEDKLKALSQHQLRKLGQPRSGYDITLAYGKYHDTLDKPITEMTLGEIDRLQTAMLAHPQNRLNSSAVGRYQIIRTTLRDLKKKLKLSDEELYSPELQDRLGLALLGNTIQNWKAGTTRTDVLNKKLSKIWDSIPYQGTAGWAGSRRHKPPHTTQEQADELFSYLEKIR
jgi:muramidase (phage lysozyme)